MRLLYERIGKIVRVLEQARYHQSKVLDNVFIKQGDFKTIEAADNSPSPFEPYHVVNDQWGDIEQRQWFRIKFEMPEIYNSKKVMFGLETGRSGWEGINPQLLVYVNGQSRQGFDMNHRQVLLTESATTGQAYTLDLHAYVGRKHKKATFLPSIFILDDATEQMYYDLKVPLEVVSHLDENDKRRVDLINILNDAVNILDLRKLYSKEYYDSLEKATLELKTRLYDNEKMQEDYKVTCVGHTHIDVAWLWDLRQTREKVARSFSTVMELMSQYPEYVFMSSQPQLYKYLKEEHPDIYARVKELVKEGRWEAEGAMWLEADCNITSGESLIRQVLFGTRFFRDEFGVENKMLWLPDVFGYSAALPGILKGCGIDYFMTTKISWNEYNKIPNDTFMWEGLDGQEVLTHFITTNNYKKDGPQDKTTYNGKLNASQTMGAWQRYQQKEMNDDVLLAYGFGDGGGGPTKEMLEVGRRLEKGIPGCPTVKQGKALDFFERLEEKVKDHPHLAKWVGELYLEYHRGTYTTMARNKRYNRKGEFLYQDLEWVYTLRQQLCGKEDYPQDTINDGWEILLLNQFHDIIPGSSIKEVYDESKEQYEEIMEVGTALLGKGLNDIAKAIKCGKDAVIAFNSLSFERDDIITFVTAIDIKGLVDQDGNLAPVQKLDHETYIAHVKGLPSKGYKVYNFVTDIKELETKAAGQIESMQVNDMFIQTPFYELELDENAEITSIYDIKNDRQVLKEGETGNKLMVFEDRPHNYDAWDVNIYYQEKSWEVNDVTRIKVVEKGPVRISLEIQRKYMDSTIQQKMFLYHDSPRIDFENVIDWKEDHVLLKAAFPVDVHAYQATYEIQYGNVERPTHWNTSWDYARFEVCGHKWADLSEYDYGVSLLNDCKYGYDIKDSVMRLSLIKCSTHPNPDADKEMHYFTYSILPHAGGWRQGGTVQEAYQLNCPVHTVVKEGTDAEESTLSDASLAFLTVDQENVIVEVVKKAEDSNDVIIRAYECYNKKTNATFQLNLDAVEIYACNHMEKREKSLGSGKTFTDKLNPYEIKTYSVKFK